MNKQKWLRHTELKIKLCKLTLNLYLFLLKMSFSEFHCLIMEHLKLKLLKRLLTESHCITMSIMLRTLKSNAQQRKMSLTNYWRLNRLVLPAQLERGNFKQSQTASTCFKMLFLLSRQSRRLSLTTTKGRQRLMSITHLRIMTGAAVDSTARYTKNTSSTKNDKPTKLRMITKRNQ